MLTSVCIDVSAAVSTKHKHSKLKMAEFEPPRKKVKTVKSDKTKSANVNRNDEPALIKDVSGSHSRGLVCNYVNNRSFGLKKRSDFSEWATKTWYSHLKSVRIWPENDSDLKAHKAIYNLGFSPDNKYLIAACENSSILVFDPCLQKKVHQVSDAHTDGVNCITFLDTRTFATGSDDNTIALWDVRNLQSEIVRMEGHTSWVKSIAYNSETKQLLSSALDGTVRLWDVNKNYVNGSVSCRKLLSVPYLTRTQLSPDFKKMVVATTTGLLFIIHNVKLGTLRKDAKPTIQKLMSNRIKGIKAKRHKKFNRVECVTDFPFETNPWCIASLQMHPSGKYVLSRYTSEHVSSEWSAIHDIQAYDDPGNTSISRLHSYVEETNLASGYIKELCFNDNGRVICSPFGNSIRLLSFSSNCSDIDCMPKNDPNELIEIGFITRHKNSVLTSRFAPHLPLLASGCLDGRVVFYQPRF